MPLNFIGILFIVGYYAPRIKDHDIFKKRMNQYRIKISSKQALLSFSLFSVCGATFASNTEQDIQRLESRIQQLEQQVESQNTKINEKTNNPFSNVEISGLVEVEAFVTEPDSGESESDITLATVELGIASNITKNLRAEVVFLFEEDETDLEIDVAELTYAFANTPISISAGQLYVPFGSFDTGLVSDPLTLEIGETRETTFKLNYELGPIAGSLYAFNGDINRNGGNDIENWGANVSYTDNGLNVGIGYINSLGDSDAIQDSLANQDPSSFSDGFTANFSYAIGAFTFIGEYVTALNGFNDAAFNGAEPSASNLEVDYSINLFGKPGTLIAAYQTTNDSLALELPETKFLLGLGVEFNDNFGLAFEYTNEEDYGVSEGGSGESSDTLTAQLAISF